MLARKFFWMPKLPFVSGEDVVKALSKHGFTVRNGKGSHVILQRNDSYINITVPMHTELKLGTLRAIIRQAGLTVDEFLYLL